MLARAGATRAAGRRPCPRSAVRSSGHRAHQAAPVTPQTPCSGWLGAASYVRHECSRWEGRGHLPGELRKREWAPSVFSAWRRRLSLAFKVMSKASLLPELEGAQEALTLMGEGAPGAPTACCFLERNYGRLQARILEWVAISFSRGSSRPRVQTHISCIGRWILYRLSYKGEVGPTHFSPRQSSFILSASVPHGPCLLRGMQCPRACKPIPFSPGAGRGRSDVPGRGQLGLGCCQTRTFSSACIIWEVSARVSGLREPCGQWPL